MATTVAPARAAVPERIRLVVPKHHALVRLTHWVNVPLLAILIATGLSIYWAAPVFQHETSMSKSSNGDYIADAGVWLVRHVPGLSGYAQPQNWIYDHFGIGAYRLAQALRLHWLFAFLFMANGALYIVGLLAGGGYKALLPRRSDFREALAMTRYYLGVVPAKLLRRPWPHPIVAGKYNALQRAGYLSMPLFGAIAILSGWAMHKPVQLTWLERLFGSYDGARRWHFATMCVFAAFVVPHVVLVVADGWDTFRSMIVGWSERFETEKHGRD
jgi:thiosulfate reductase cytochrome b subunit